ncbi:MAG: hypothetical protein JXQ83_10700, partial [Candidatus Glassbacteria bacterium]|nr:hypothetical protein [Candidatus Glassbacteria bacterium]
GPYTGDELVVEMADGVAGFVHSKATFNCCMDSVTLELDSAGGVLRVIETEHTAEACRCICDFTVHGEIYDLASGRYTLEVVSSADPKTVLCSAGFEVP